MIHSVSPQKDFYGEVMASALAKNTRIAYDKGWRRFSQYCEDHGVDPWSATPEDVGKFFIYFFPAMASSHNN